MFKPLAPVRNYMHKPDLLSNAMHVVHTRSIYVSHLTLTIYTIFYSVLYSTSDLSNGYSVFCEIRRAKTENIWDRLP
jgi:hypothetical protein